MSWSAPTTWIVAGLILFALEAVSPVLILMFFGLGAILTACAALAFDIDLSWQLIIFCLASVLSLLCLRGSLKRIFHGRTSGIEPGLQRIDSFTGEIAQVSEAITAGGIGRVKARGSFYSATSSSALEPGAMVVIIEDSRPDHSLFVVEPKA